MTHLENTTIQNMAFIYFIVLFLSKALSDYLPQYSYRNWQPLYVLALSKTLKWKRAILKLY